MEVLLDVTSVITREDYTLELVFENGERRIFDMKPFLDKKPFIKLILKEIEVPNQGVLIPFSP